MLILTLCVFAISFITVLSQGMMGAGIWNLINIAKCDTVLNNVVVQIDIKRHMINRTHDGITATMDLDKDVDDTFGVIIEVCKYVDGGCKQYQVITDESIVNLVKKYAEKNVKRVLEQANVDPPDFPVSQGHYEVEDFIMDYCELPTTAIYGKFEAEVFMLENQIKVACLKVIIEFNQPEDDEEVCV